MVMHYVGLFQSETWVRCQSCHRHGIHLNNAILTFLRDMATDVHQYNQILYKQSNIWTKATHIAMYSIYAVLPNNERRLSHNLTNQMCNFNFQACNALLNTIQNHRNPTLAVKTKNSVIKLFTETITIQFNIQKHMQWWRQIIYGSKYLNNYLQWESCYTYN